MNVDESNNESLKKEPTNRVEMLRTFLNIWAPKVIKRKYCLTCVGIAQITIKLSYNKLYNIEFYRVFVLFQDDLTGQAILDVCFARLNLIETAYFGLRYLDEENQTVSHLYLDFFFPSFMISFVMLAFLGLLFEHEE